MTTLFQTVTDLMLRAGYSLDQFDASALISVPTYTSAKNLYFCGSDNNGHSGDGLTTDTTTFRASISIPNGCKLCSGSFTVFFIKPDGTLWAWGRNSSGETGIGYNSGYINTPQQIGNDNDWVDIKCGTEWALALKRGGTIWSTGKNDVGQGGRGAGGTVYSFTQIGTDTDWMIISAGALGGHAIKTNRTLWGWGLGQQGQIGDGTTTNRTSPVQVGIATDWASVSRSRFNGHGIKVGGSLWGWGAGGAVGDGTTTDRLSPVQVGVDVTWIYVTSVYGMNTQTYGIKANRTLWSWGSASTPPRLGFSSAFGEPAPTQVGTDVNWLKVISNDGDGDGFSLGLKTDGTLYSWGYGGDKSLGQGSTANIIVPTRVGSDADWLDIAVGDYFSFALKPATSDVSYTNTITKPVRALAVSEVASSRSPIEMLMSAYYFEMTLSDKIYFIPRGIIGAAAVIPYADLGARRGGGPITSRFPIKQATDIELPALISLTCLNASNDYNKDTQMSDRITTAVSNTVEELQLPLAFTPDENKGIANTIAADKQLALVTSTISVPGKYCHVEPTDRIYVYDKVGSYYLMRVMARHDNYPLLEFDLVFEDGSILTDSSPTDTGTTSTSVVLAVPETDMVLMDIPILRDADNDPGIYVATKAASAGSYAGSVVYSSVDDVVYTAEVSITESAIFGTTSDTLGAWTGNRVFDEMNSVTVDIGAGVVSSVSRDLILADQTVNAWLIGTEIIQAREATFVSPGVYILSGLLRGCRGTEQFMTGHGSGEQAILLRTTGLRRIARIPSDLGYPRYYKGATIGEELSLVSPEVFYDYGVGVLPFSPVDARISRDLTGNITTTWQRRTRMATRMIGPLGISIPLGEDIQAYDQIIFTDNTYLTIKRVIPVTAPTAAYSAADQTTDFGSPQSTIYTAIYQRSAIAGRGYPLKLGA